MPAAPTALLGMSCWRVRFPLLLYFWSVPFIYWTTVHWSRSSLCIGVAEKAIDFLEGKRPSSIAAASLLFIFNLLGLQNKVNELANVASISPHTLRNVYKDICQNLDRLPVHLFDNSPAWCWSRTSLYRNWNTLSSQVLPVVWLSVVASLVILFYE